jgi:hypothetical protein
METIMKGPLDPNLPRRCKLALVAIAFAALPSAFAQSPAGGQALAQADAATPDFAMSAQQQPFRSVADEFMAAATAGDATKSARMLSPTIVAKTGTEGVERFLTGEVLPFFSQFKGVGSSITVSRTADVTGFVFYMYMVSKTDELRPFVIYVIEEGGAKVVANVLVDHFVATRHCARVASRWKCPDFS